MAEPAPPPRAQYEARLARRRATLAGRRRLDGRLSDARLATVLSMLPLAWAVWGWHRIGGVWLLVPAAVFAALAVIHERVIAAAGRAAAAVRFHEQSLARLSGRPVGPDGRRFLDDGHPYAADLDLFGEGSLFSLLCTARTQPGEAALAAWLLSPAGAVEIRGRQQAVRELAPDVDLREDLAVLGAEAGASLRPEALVRWATAPAALPATTWLPATCLALAVSVAGTLAGWAAGRWGPVPFLACVLLVAALHRLFSRRVQEILGRLEAPSGELRTLSRLMERFSRESFSSAELARLKGAMSARGESAPAQVARLGRLLDLAEARRNQFFAPFAFLALWGPLLAWALEGWRRRCGPHVAGWLAAVGELEALESFATYAFDHPADAFPELAEGGPLYDAVGLTHPLLPEDRAVRNDLALGAPVRLLLVSGSNMSGKSTLLRSVGTSVAMALAGAPVRARSLRLAPLALGASLLARDSLQAGSSRFYAEIRRLRQITDLAGGERPLLFLLDEILAGTNSHDRRQGAEAVLSALVARGALGLVTSHDLALAEIVPRLGERAANVHFVDHLEAGKLVFDYRLRPGLVEKSNAVELMRAIGLPV